MAEVNEFGLLARLLRYPEHGYGRESEQCAAFFTGHCPQVGAYLGGFFEQTRSLSLEDLQTLYTATFDLNPVCSLELGWHLFGENYERGELMVKMRAELRRHGIEESGELPDHLTHALDLLGRMEREDAAAFAGACLFPAMDKMRAAIEGKSNPFESVLIAANQLLELRHPRTEAETPTMQTAFSILN